MHPLTLLVIGEYFANREHKKADSLITAWLTKKAEELDTDILVKGVTARRILGLEAKKETSQALCNQCLNPLIKGICTCKEHPVETRSEKWCEHMTWQKSSHSGKMCWYMNAGMGFDASSDCNFCPQCATPRPEPKKTLAEVLRDQCVWTFVGKDKTSSPMWETVASSALSYFVEMIEGQPASNDPEDYSHTFKTALIQKVRECK